MYKEYLLTYKDMDLGYLPLCWKQPPVLWSEPPLTGLDQSHHHPLILLSELTPLPFYPHLEMTTDK